MSYDIVHLLSNNLVDTFGFALPLCLHFKIHTEMFQVFACNLPLPSYEALVHMRR